MADIRIKDLTTTASSTASDDFIAVDGTTNGTRKLNAFSPTFGGNATVTGTLSSGGNLSVRSTSAQIIIGEDSASQLTYLVRPRQAGGAIQIVQDSATVNRWLALGGCDNNGVFYESLRVASNISIPGTTASTTTSTGALVVGNGTSGGLGVGGQINAGSGSHIFGNAASTAQILVQRITTNPSSVSINALVSFANIDFGSEGGGYTFGAIKSNGSEVLRIFNGNLAAITPVAGGGLAVGGGLNVSATTASTTTSSGALVVSGGVGVAGKVTSTALGLANTSQSISAWGDIGPQLSIAGAVVTDTTSSGTVSRAVANSINATAFAASSSTTYTQAVSLFIADAPTANTNVTITHRYALYTAGGRINFQGLPTSSAGLQAGTLWNDGGTLKVA